VSKAHRHFVKEAKRAVPEMVEDSPRRFFTHIGRSRATRFSHIACLRSCFRLPGELAVSVLRNAASQRLKGDTSPQNGCCTVTCGYRARTI
jgi:hypothetical protein